MISEISPLLGLNTAGVQAAPTAQGTALAKAQDEFLAIFYKELLKQAFTAPDLGPADEAGKTEASFSAVFNKDIMIEQLAQQLVKSNSLRPDWFKR